METNKVAAWIVVIVVIILVVLVLCYWFWSGNKSGAANIEPQTAKTLNSMKRNLNETCCLTREYIIESVYNLPGKFATREALEHHYRATFLEYFDGCKERTGKVTEYFMSKYPLYDQVADDPETIKCAKDEAHRINVNIAALLSFKGCPHNAKLVSVLDSIDLANFEQITTMKAEKFAESHKAFAASCAATHNLARWLSISYVWNNGEMKR